MNQNRFLPGGMSQPEPEALFTPQIDFRGARRQGDGVALPALLQGVAPSRPAYRGPGRETVEIPWGSPGTGCTLLFEALVVALLRQMPLSAAAGILRKLDNRLWRVAQLMPDRPGQGKLPQFLRMDHPNGRKPGTCLGVFYDLDSTYTVVAASRICFNQKGSDAGAGSEEVRRLFLIAVIEAFLKAAAAPGRQGVAGNSGAAPGKVSAEEAVLFPSQSRAPPDQTGRTFSARVIGEALAPRQFRRHSRRTLGGEQI